MPTELHTERLHLRLVKKADALHIHELNSLPETDEYNTLGIPESIDVTKAIVEESVAAQRARPPQKYVFVIELGDAKKFVGLIGMNMGRPNYKLAEIFYKIMPAYWGVGYTTEALKRIIEFGFVDLLLHRMEAGCATANTASVRVLEKAGMKREGMRRKALPLKSGWADNYIYGIVEDD
jgi:ribosomal-protein-alanine N-acetyltransferase